MTKKLNQTSLQQDFLANLSQSQENKNQTKMTEISGRKLLELSKSPDPLGLLEKTLMELLNSISIQFLRTWKEKTTPQGSLIFQLQASVRGTKGKGSGLFPTPTAACEIGGVQADRVEQTKSGAFILRKKNKPHMKYGANLRDMMHYSNNVKTGGQLNPVFVEHLMGFPMNWTKIDEKE